MTKISRMKIQKKLYEQKVYKVKTQIESKPMKSVKSKQTKTHE